MRSTIVFAGRRALYTLPRHLPAVLPTQRREIMADVIFCFYLMCFHNLQEPQETGIHYVCHAALSTHLHEWPWSKGAFLTLKCRIFCIYFFCSAPHKWSGITLGEKMTLHMGVVGYRATSVTRWKQLGEIHGSTGAEHYGKVEEEREGEVSLTTISQHFRISSLFWNSWLIICCTETTWSTEWR